MPRAPGTISIERYRRLQVLNDCFSRGGYTLNELAARFGVTMGVIAEDRRYIMENWWAEEENHATRDKRLQRIKELEQIKRFALESYTRSRQDKEKLTTKFDTNKCENCEDGKTAFGKCLDCEGTGYVHEEVVTREITGQAGDASFLKVAKDCVTELLKVEALYMQPEVKVQHVLSGEIRHRTDSHKRFEGIDPDSVIEAKVVLAKLEMKAMKVKDVVDGNVVNERDGGGGKG